MLIRLAVCMVGRATAKEVLDATWRGHRVLRPRQTMKLVWMILMVCE